MLTAVWTLVCLNAELLLLLVFDAAGQAELTLQLGGGGTASAAFNP